MKCKRCNKEVKGTICSYCGEIQDIPEEKIILPSHRGILKYAIFFAVIALGLGVLSNYFNQVLLLGIVIGIIGLWISFRHLQSIEKKWFFLAELIAILGLFLTSVSTIKYVSQEFDKITAAKKYEELLEINIPRQKAIVYHIDYGYDSGYKTVSYGYNLTETEYQDILADVTWLETSNYFLELIDGQELDGKYAIFDYEKDTWDLPDDVLKYHFIVIRIVQKEGNYKLEIVDVSKRQY